MREKRIIARTATLRNAGRDAGAARGGVRSTRCTLPGGVPGGPLFHRSTFLSTSEKNFHADDLQPENFFVRGASEILSHRNTVIPRGVKKGQKKANFTEISSGLFLHRRLVHP